MNTLAHALRQRRCAFVPFITAGDPTLSATDKFFPALADAGADIIELGVPFSDPVADGPVIQAADERALLKGATLEKILALASRLRRRGQNVPIILFTYLNPVLKFGFEKFAARCASSGINGALIVDLPAEDCLPLSRALEAKKVELVLLASPTTSDARLRLIGRRSGSIVYYVSREGVTGVHAGLAVGLKRRLKKVRALTGKPLIVGFGVARREQAQALAKHCAGVVVGSALVAEIARARNVKEAASRLKKISREIVAGLRA